MICLAMLSPTTAKCGMRRGCLGSAGVWGGAPAYIECCAFSLKIWHLVATILMIFLRTNWQDFVCKVTFFSTSWFARTLQYQRSGCDKQYLPECRSGSKIFAGNICRVPAPPDHWWTDNNRDKKRISRKISTTCPLVYTNMGWLGTARIRNLWINIHIPFCNEMRLENICSIRNNPLIWDMKRY